MESGRQAGRSESRTAPGADAARTSRRWILRIVLALAILNLLLAALWWRPGSVALSDPDGSDPGNVGDVDIRRKP